MNRYDVFFPEDVAARLVALHQCSQRHLAQAEQYGMHPMVAQLCAAVYAGALSDAAASFGLPPGTIDGREALEVEAAALKEPSQLKIPRF